MSLYYVDSFLLDDPGCAFIRECDRIKEIATFNKIKYKAREKRISGTR